MTNLIIISGVSRCGKTQLASQLVKKGCKQGNFVVISGDAIINGLLRGLPNKDFVQYNNKHHSKDKNYQYIKGFLVEYIKVIDGHYSNIILESELLTPYNWLDFKNSIQDLGFNLIYVALVQARITTTQKLKIYSKNPQKLGWMSVYDSTELERVTNDHLLLCQKVKQDCIDQDLIYFDTSFYFQKTINQAQKWILQQLKN